MCNVTSTVRLWLALAVVAGVIAYGGAPLSAEQRPAAAGIGSGLRLVMVDDVGCQYCRKWDAEVGVIYERSTVGAVAPLERRAKRHRDLVPYEPLAYTPTFILVRDGAEIGRIVGYPGADFFWAEFERLVAKAGPVQEPAMPAGQAAGAHDASLRSSPPVDGTDRLRAAAVER